ncbi:hypothetical protein [Sagittula salina]|uniref:Tetratricopeptide repeat protein n=1 Tax=Sagittula salina TaxID=2820268 RepID=A0A940MNA3_9RHOB|nr:hypothetical protein [Sagittula salina]MBP0481786.1 hypothetical protein [Sagittula salina]
MPRTALFLALLPVDAMAAGGDTSAPPSHPQFKTGQVWEPASQKCLTAHAPTLDDAARLVAVREYAYDGQFHMAALVLDAMQDQQADGVLTYRGFLARRRGAAAEARAWYGRALARNPDNLLARSYTGQGLVFEGDLVGALIQHRENVARGGRGTWAEATLAEAISTGTAYAY